VPSLTQEFLFLITTIMAGLRKFGSLRAKFCHFAASICSFAAILVSSFFTKVSLLKNRGSF